MFCSPLKLKHYNVYNANTLPFCKADEVDSADTGCLPLLFNTTVTSHFVYVKKGVHQRLDYIFVTLLCSSNHWHTYWKHTELSYASEAICSILLIPPLHILPTHSGGHIRVWVLYNCLFTQWPLPQHQTFLWGHWGQLGGCELYLKDLLFANFQR